MTSTQPEAPSGLALPFSQRLSEAKDALTESVESAGALLGKTAQLTADLSTVVDSIDGADSTLLKLSVTDATFALHSAATAEYRGAFASLRSCTELGIAAVYYSARDLEQRLWLSGARQFSWSAAIGPDGSGPYTSEFIAAYGSSNLIELAPAYRDRVTSSYSICSDIIHGRRHIYSDFPDGLHYSQNLLAQWSSCANDSLRALLFAIVARFGHEISNSHAAIDTVRDVFGHHEQVRELADSWCQ